MRCAVGVMARAPSSGGKTRLAPHLTPARLTALSAALLADTLHAIEQLPDVTIFFTPDDMESDVAAYGAGAIARVPQVEGDLGARMLSALRYLLRRPDGARAVPLDGARAFQASGAILVGSDIPLLQQPGCLTPGGQTPRGLTPDAAILTRGRTPDAAILVGSDIPLLTADHLREAEETLQTSGGVVLGPADDGGYYLIGMTQVHAGLFEQIAWGTESVLTDTLRAAERAGVEARLVRSAYDVDTIDDLRRLERDLALAPADRCPALRRWFREA